MGFYSVRSMAFLLHLYFITNDHTVNQGLIKNELVSTKLE